MLRLTSKLPTRNLSIRKFSYKQEKYNILLSKFPPNPSFELQLDLLGLQEELAFNTKIRTLWGTSLFGATACFGLFLTPYGIGSEPAAMVAFSIASHYLHKGLLVSNDHFEAKYQDLVKKISKE